MSIDCYTGAMKSVLVIGGTGMLGSDLCVELSRRGYEVIAPSRAEFDITDPMAIAEVATEKYSGTEWCINCSAYTAVDKAESEVGLATDLNHLSPAGLALACRMAKMRFVHVSTDFVFDGTAHSPYTEDMPTHPLGVYGRTKRDGEEAVRAASASAIIVRTSWLFGPNGNSFPKTMIRAYESGPALRVVADQIGCPTYTAHLASGIVDLMELAAPGGIYHLSGPESMSWHEFAIHSVTEWSGTQPQIQAITSEEYPTPAVRPKYSVLSNEKAYAAGVTPMPPLSGAIAEFCSRLRAIGLA